MKAEAWRSQKKDVDGRDLSTACNDFYSYACASPKPNDPREHALEEFNQMLDEEVKLLPANLNQMFSIEQLVDVIKKVRDVVAFENIRKKNPRINEAFQRTREFFETIRQEYLDFINSTTSDNPEHLAMWYTRAARVELEMPMRTHKFFVAEHLYFVSGHLNCTENVG
ncbi:hypothetical protein COOONC_07542 [Cooperia oncophora]